MKPPKKITYIPVSKPQVKNQTGFFEKHPYAIDGIILAMIILLGVLLTYNMIQTF